MKKLNENGLIVGLENYVTSGDPLNQVAGCLQRYPDGGFYIKGKTTYPIGTDDIIIVNEINFEVNIMDIDIKSEIFFKWR